MTSNFTCQKGAAMCCGDEGAGPDVDVDFFAEIDSVFAKYPAVSHKYSIDTFPSEAEKLGVDLETHIGVTRYEKDRLIIEFVPRESLAIRRRHCCRWRGDVCLLLCGQDER